MAAFRRNLTSATAKEMSGEEIAERLGLKFAPDSKLPEFEKADLAAKKFIKEVVECSTEDVLEYHRLWALIWTMPELEVRAIADRLLEKFRDDRHAKQFGAAKRMAGDPKIQAKVQAMKAARWLFWEWVLGRVNFNNKIEFANAVLKEFDCLSQESKHLEVRMTEWRDAALKAGHTRAATLWRSRSKK